MAEILDAKSWFSAIEKSCFGLILPTGWFGRPYGNQHVIEEYRIDADGIYIRFDKIREINIFHPQSVVVEKDDSGRTNLRISNFQSAEFKWVPYGDETAKPSIEKFSSGDFILVGYYI